MILRKSCSSDECIIFWILQIHRTMIAFCGAGDEGGFVKKKKKSMASWCKMLFGSN